MKAAITAISGDMDVVEFAHNLDQTTWERNEAVQPSDEESDAKVLEMRRYLMDFEDIKDAMSAFNRAAVLFVLEYPRLKKFFGLPSE